MAEKEYQRLTGARVRRQGVITAVAVRSSLWLGKDHLLRVDSAWYAEEYKRFYFRDIQAIILRASRRRLFWNLALGTLTGLCLLGWGYGFVSGSTRDGGSLVAAALMISLFAVPLLINNLLGPTCVCQLRTAVQTEELPSLSRVQRVRKVLRRIRPLIAAVQGEIVPEEIPARMQALAGIAPAAAVPGPAPAEAAANEPGAPPRMQP